MNEPVEREQGPSGKCISPKCGQVGVLLRWGAKSQTTWGPWAAFLMVLDFFWVQLGFRSRDSECQHWQFCATPHWQSHGKHGSVSGLQFLHL